ncbi:uncharacterized protein LOC123698360 isoform X4 [Colias croceus]|uniref:uncharacterized protein LOC123698360 isoform X4 n=1 Tax=Colias crocea TaxID=72248 RepID=UPI001E27E5D8|nr:uncharacterized protein LOC123698360 isoform X4 [Colias croceus]
MRLLFTCLLVAVLVYVECNHTFMGSNVFRPLLFHRTIHYGSHMFSKRVENFSFSTPSYHQSIQGILAYDLTNSSASANVTQGGIGYTYVTLRMKSDRGREIKYDVFIYG